jgi:glycosyltransferase involved in cell wall biosynthesis
MLIPTRVQARPLRTRPRVSVVIPNYNYAHFLCDAIASALDQPDVDVDVLVIDNASTDNSVAVVEKIAAEDSRVQLIRHDVNKGTIYSFNEGVRTITGDYYALLCSDDLLTRGSLARSTALLEAHPNVGFTYGYLKSFTDELPAAESRVTGWSVWPGRRWMAARYRDARNVIVTAEVVMRRSVMDQLYYDTRFRDRSDLLLWLRAALICDVGRVHGPVQAFHRIHDASLSATEYSGMMHDFRSRLGVFSLVLDEEGKDLPVASEWRRNVRRALAQESLRLARRCYDRGEALYGGTAEEYEDFAVDTWPGIRRTLAWQNYQLRARGRAPRWLRQGTEQAYRVQHHLEWRLWRRYGI